MDASISAEALGRSSARYAVLLCATAVSYAVWHHLGLVPHGFGDTTHGTRIADWIDLVTPYVVLGPALLTLAAAAPPVRTWLCFLLGSWVYVDGHGMHLSANSVGNSPGYLDPPRTAHLWDEYVGHYLWFGGVAVVAACLASTMPAHPRPRGVLRWVVAVAAAELVGLTWATNSVGGNMSAFGLPVGLVAAVWGWRHRADLGVVLVPAGLTSAVLLAGHLLLGVGG